MKRLFLLIAFCVANSGTADLRQLSWEDLRPHTEALSDPLADVPMDLRFDLGFIAKVVADAEVGNISRKSPEFRNAMTLLGQLSRRVPDADELLDAVASRDREIARRNLQVNESLDGALVRLPGYALPLEFVGQNVTEFLLVPFVGACIHVPPPPPNQIVFAELAEPYEVKNLYDPVWITGRLHARGASTSLFLVDGEADIPMGYSMDVVRVEALE